MSWPPERFELQERLEFSARGREFRTSVALGRVDLVLRTSEKGLKREGELAVALL
jgi:hypothetical protein